jgi:hypothetical protein
MSSANKETLLESLSLVVQRYCDSKMDAENSPNLLRFRGNASAKFRS